MPAAAKLGDAMSNPAEKVIIEVALNENQSKADNPNVPYSPDEILDDARRCFDAGASMVHYHGRDPITGRAANDDVDLNLAIQTMITSELPVISYPTYGNRVRIFDGYYVVGGPAEGRCAHIAAGLAKGVRFEIGSIDLGSAFDLNGLWMRRGNEDEKWAWSRGLQINSGHDHVWLNRFCEENGLRKSFAAFDTVHLINLRNLMDQGLVTDNLVLMKLFLIGGWSLPKRLRHALDLMADLFEEKEVVWTPVAVGVDCPEVADTALSLGGHLRTGLGDHHRRESGSPTNAELVEQLVDVARSRGREPASPDEARTIQGLPTLAEQRSEVGRLG
jgi:uncharacterized protein (DUF849 family)